jgi:hypothetical protein
VQIVFSPFLEFVCEQRQVSHRSSFSRPFSGQHSASGNGSNFYFVVDGIDYSSGFIAHRSIFKMTTAIEIFSRLLERA